jgi:ABC-type sugar transport system substrate-binding protein
MSTIHLQVAGRVGPSHPRGSRLAAALFLALSRGVAAMAASATAHSHRPEQDVQQVRELAWSYRDSDPGFAADLSAAADRHERQLGLS